ncbi:MAG TPA: HRDC domain-containing protein [Myxococcaceae bacterium]|nr:HRDC domain-containing protein [Myxococcaceae bacterium]
MSEVNPFHQPVHDVRGPAEVAGVADALAGADLLAVDVEADALHAFRPRLCFVQLGTDRDIWLLDTLETPGLAPLAPLFHDPTLTKVFHAAGGDLQFLAEAGVRVRGLFDTHRAATLLGWPQVGLADLVSQSLGTKLTKEHQQADFAQRPLPAPLHDYIADDVRYLTELGRRVRSACQAADILEEVLLDCERLADEAAVRPEVARFEPKIPRSLPAADQAFLAAAGAALHALRLKWAEAADVPMGKMLSNAGLQEILTRAPKDLRALARTPGVRGQVVREHGEEVLELLRRVRAQADRGELQPPPPLARDAAKKKREDALKAWRSEAAAARKVTPSVVLTNPLVEALARERPHSREELALIPYLGEKRVRLYGDALLRLLR